VGSPRRRAMTTVVACDPPATVRGSVATGPARATFWEKGPFARPKEGGNVAQARDRSLRDQLPPRDVPGMGRASEHNGKPSIPM